MSPSPIRWEQDSDGIVTLVLDAPGRNANTMTDEHRDAMDAALDRLNEEKDSVTGVVLTSAKRTFFAGGNLEHLSQVTDDTSAEFAASIGKVKAGLRRLETLAARSSPRSTALRSGAGWRSPWRPITASCCPIPGFR